MLAFNQEAYVSSRYHFVEGTEEQVTDYWEALYDYLHYYAETVEGNPYFPPDLQVTLNEFDNAGTARVWGGEGRVGAVVLSEEPFDENEFFPICRTAAVMPVANISDALIAKGGQRIVSLAGAGRGVIGLPHDAFYPWHRMVRWAVDESY